MKSLAAGIAKAKSTDTEKLVAAFKGLKVDSPFGPFMYRASDHQATMGAYVGKIALENGKGTMSRLQICRRRFGAAGRCRGQEAAARDGLTVFVRDVLSYRSPCTAGGIAIAGKSEPLLNRNNGRSAMKNSGNVRYASISLAACFVIPLISCD